MGLREEQELIVLLRFVDHLTLAEYDRAVTIATSLPVVVRQECQLCRVNRSSQIGLCHRCIRDILGRRWEVPNFLHTRLWELALVRSERALTPGELQEIDLLLHNAPTIVNALFCTCCLEAEKSICDLQLCQRHAWQFFYTGY